MLDDPDMTVEIVVENSMTDIVAGRFDAGIGLGEPVEKGMVAARVGPDLRMDVVGAPAFFAKRKKLRTPRELTEYVYINLHLPTLGGIYASEFEKGGES